MLTRLMPLFEPLVEEAIGKHSMGEDISWEVFADIHPQYGPVFVAALFLADPANIGEYLTFLAVLTPPAKVVNHPEAVDRQIADAIGQLLEMRSRVLNGQPAVPPPPGAPGVPVGGNGGPVPPPGLQGLSGGL